MLQSYIQSLLFASAKPLTLRQLCSLLDISREELEQELRQLMEAMNTETSGIHIAQLGDGYQLVTNPSCAKVVEKIAKEEPGELTRPSLETLTVIAYRGPLTRPELEAIRGVQCSLILRNLLIRGLIVEREDPTRGEAVYTLSGDTLRFLGVHSEKDLPDFATFHTDVRLTQLVDALDSL